MKIIFPLILALFLMVSACAPTLANTPTSGPATLPVATSTSAATTFTLTSSAFANGEAIPEIYTCSGKSKSPALAWGEPPAGTQTFALIVDDPDASGFTHWVIYNIPADRRELPEAIETGQELNDGIYQGLSGGAVFGYVGPCPPALHHYVFRLYALDIQLKKEQGVGKKLLLDAIQGHILAQAKLTGTFQP